MSDAEQTLRLRVTRALTDYLSVILGSFSNGGGWGFTALVGVVASGFVFFPGAARPSPTLLADTATAGVLAALSASALALAGLAAKAWNVSRLPGALAPTFYTFSDHGIEIESPAGRGSTKWDIWSRAVETRAHFVLLSQRGVAHVLPKRDLDGDQRMRLRILLNDALRGPAKVFVECNA